MTTSTQAQPNGRTIQIQRGLDLPITGIPQQDVIDEKLTKTVALIASDYVGMKPTMEVNEGDAVRAGQVIFSDKKTPGVVFTAPYSGKVTGIHRGEKRRFLSVVIDVDGDDQVDFPALGGQDLSNLGSETVQDRLVQSGLWTAFRKRPFGKVPSPETRPHSIFVTAMDTAPLALDPKPLIKQRGDEFVYGLHILKQLTDGPVHLCVDPGANLPGSDLAGVNVHEFSGPHPAGLPGTHIHFVDPISDKKNVWHLYALDVIDIGAFFASGKLPTERIISLGGPGVERPRLLKTRVGANLSELTTSELKIGQQRTISGSVLDGRIAGGETGFLGRYHHQVSVLPEGTKREFLGWQMPGFDKFSIRRIFASSLSPGRTFDMTTSTGGSERAMVPIGMFEDVMPLDILPTFLLRSLHYGDNEQAQQLGALELIEEDLALCTFVDPGKVEWGPLLRERLTQIEREG